MRKHAFGARYADGLPADHHLVEDQAHIGAPERWIVCVPQLGAQRHRKGRNFFGTDVGDRSFHRTSLQRDQPVKLVQLVLALRETVLHRPHRAKSALLHNVHKVAYLLQEVALLGE